MDNVLVPPAIKEFLNEPILSVTPLTGGSTCQTYKITTYTGAYVYKYLNEAPTDIFSEEKISLNTLATSGCFSTPDILLCTKDFIFMQYIDAVSQPRWRQCGEQLAQLHRHTKTQYGFDHNNYLATLALNNHWQEHWLDFYREQRLCPLIEHPLFSLQDRRRWDKLLNKLDRYIDNSEPASLIHGDLWNTNIVFSTQHIYLIDPAVYYASREMEIAYLEFFSPDSSELLSAYQEHYPLSTDYDERKKFYQLYPCLINIHLFGEAYLDDMRKLLNYYC